LSLRSDIAALFVSSDVVDSSFFLASHAPEAPSARVASGGKQSATFADELEIMRAYPCAYLLNRYVAHRKAIVGDEQAGDDTPRSCSRMRSISHIVCVYSACLRVERQSRREKKI
jgi:hypothetical protein